MSGVRGVRDSIPAGTVLARLGSGAGAPAAVPLRQLAQQMIVQSPNGAFYDPIAPNTLLANLSTDTQTPVGVTLSALLDAVMGSAEGDILYRDASVWKVLAPSAAGSLLQTGGAGAAPSWATLSALLDAAVGDAEGDILYRDASVWKVLPPGTAGQVLKTGGAGAAPSWVAQTAPYTVPTYTVAALPSSGVTQGALAYATDGRNPGEVAGTGTGCLVTLNKVNVWAAVWSGVLVTS